MLKTLRLRIYPNNTQIAKMNRLFGCCRFIYNLCLEKKIKAREENGIIENKKSLMYFFANELRKDERYAWLNEFNSHVVRRPINDMLDAYKHFFQGHNGYPNYKSKKQSRQSCFFPLECISKNNDYSTHKLTISGFNDLKFKCSKQYLNTLIEHKKDIRFATLIKTYTNKYFLYITIKGDFTKELKETNQAVGIDLGIKDFVVTSDGEVFDNIHSKKKEFKKLKRLQTRHNRKKAGSKNREKARLRLTKKYEKVRNKKLDYLHKVSNYLLNENQVVVMEDLNLTGMARNHSLSGAVEEVNFGEFRRMLEYKASWYGREIVFIDRFYPSSKTCNHCGYVNKKLTLADREWICPQCGATIDRDYNAALNILEEGLRIIGSRTPKSTLVDYPTMDDKEAIPLKSSDRLKQEIRVSA